jgi:hypothetical protein
VLGPFLFGLALLAFFLPFATVSCDGAQTTFTGIQLVTETVPAGGTTNDGRSLGEQVEDEASLLAMTAFAAAVVGFGLALIGVTKGPGWLAAAGLVATVLLGLKPLQSLADVTYLSGYLLAFLCFFAASLVYAVRAVKRVRAMRRAEVVPPLREEAS